MIRCFENDPKHDYFICNDSRENVILKKINFYFKYFPMKLSIRWTIIIGCIVLVWGTHLIITPLSYFMTKRVLTRHMQDIMVNISDLTMEQANNHLSKANSAASLAKKLISSNVVSSDIKGSSTLERYFFDQLSIYPHLSGIYVGGFNGNFFMVSRHKKYQPDGFRTKVIRNEDDEYRSVDLTWRNTTFHQVASEQDPSDTYDPRTRPWFKKVAEHDHIVWTDPYIFFTAQKPGVTIAGPAFDESGNLKAIVGVDIEIAELSTFISKLRVGKSGKAFILHRNGDIIAYHDSNKLIVSSNQNNTLRLPKVDELNDAVAQKSFESVNWKYDNDDHLTLNESKSASFEHDGKTYLSMFTPFPEPELPWIIGVYIPEDDYLAEIKSNQLVNIIATVIITVLASILGLLLAKKIVTPVVKLADGAKAIEAHDIETPFQVQTVFKEIQETANSFSRMKIALTDYEKKLHDNEQIYRAITKTANDAIIMMNSNLDVTYFNPAAEKMFGYDSDEVLGRKLHELLAPKQDELLYQKGLDMFMKDETGALKDRTVKVTALCKERREIPVELSLSKLKLNDSWYAVAIIRNITERRKASKLRKRLVNDLHDGIGGNLSNIKLLAEISKAHDIPEQTSKNLNAIADISEDCITEIRNYMNILDDTELSWQSFIAELHQYCAKTLEPHQFLFSMPVNINNTAPYPTTLLYMNVFKIIKEAINNVIKHSDGNEVSINTLINKNYAQWVIKDNGTGNFSSQDSGRGLLSMTSRVKELGGVIDFSWDNGVSITLNIPFTRITVREQVIRGNKMTQSVELI